MRIAALLVSAVLLGAGASRAATPRVTALAIAVYPQGMNASEVNRYIVVVKVAPGYAPDPSSHGTGTIVATFC